MYSYGGHPYLSHRHDSAFVEDNDQQTPREVSIMPRKRKVKAETSHAGNIDEDDDASKLKGVVWPGMSLFDAATPELKKKRNQKKDDSVGERLANMSEGVQKEELIFSSSGDFCKKRPITGQPQPEDDVLPGEEVPSRPPKAQRAPRKKTSEDNKPLEDKKPLEAKDFKTSIKPVIRAKSKKRGRKQQSVVAATAVDMQEDHYSEEEAPRKTKRNKRQKAPVDQAEEEGEDQSDMNEATFEQPVVMTQLTSGYQHAPMYVAAAPMGFRPAEPTYMAGQSYYQFPADHNNPFSYDQTPLATWDYYGYGMGSSMANPLFSGMYGGGFGDDDDDEDNEGTISAPISES
jgi:hypothetical protein